MRPMIEHACLEDVILNVMNEKNHKYSYTTGL